MRRLGGGESVEILVGLRLRKGIELDAGYVDTSEIDQFDVHSSGGVNTSAGPVGIGRSVSWHR